MSDLTPEQIIAAAANGIFDPGEARKLLLGEPTVERKAEKAAWILRSALLTPSPIYEHYESLTTRYSKAIKKAVEVLES